MANIVIIAEKPSLGKEIAKALGATSSKNGYMTDNKGLCVTWVFGHFLELLPPNKINPEWDGYWDVNKLPMLPDFDVKKHYKLRSDKGVKAQYNIIKGLCKEADEIVNAGDPDREGELLVRLLLENTAGIKKSTKMSRIWLLDLNSSKIKQAFEKRKPASQYINFYKSALARQHADWMYGMNLTQLYTLKAKSNPKNEDKGVRSVGRVQTAVVEIVVDRELVIRNFVPEVFYNIYCYTHNKQLSSQWFEMQTDEDGKETMNTRIMGKDGVKEIHGKIKSAKEAAVESINKTVKKEYNKGLYSKTDLTAEASRKLGLSGEETTDIMQALYERHKVLSYPRTDNNYLNDDDFDGIVVPVLKELEQVDDFKDFVAHLKTNKLIKANTGFINSKKVTAHTGLTPIIPEARSFASTYNSLNDNEKAVLGLVIRKLLGNMYDPYKYESSQIVFNVNGELFKANGKILLDKGWKVLWEEFGKSLNDDVELPDMKEGDTVTIDGFDLKKKETQPPKKYSEADLLTYMKDIKNILKMIDRNDEGRYDVDKGLVVRIKAISGDGDRKLGLGTPATRENIVKTVVDRGYVTYAHGGYRAEEKGEQLIGIIDNERINPVVTVKWEDKLNKIAEGEYTYDEFISEIKQTLKDIVKKEKGSVTFGSSNQNKKELKEKCPECGKPLVEKSGENKKTGKAWKLKECSGGKSVKKGTKWVKTGCQYMEWL